MTSSDIVTSQYVSIKQTPASVGERMLARLIDSIVLYVYMISMYVLVDGLMNYYYISDDFLRLSFVFILFAAFLFYSLLCEWLFNGQSIGKRCMGLRVVMVDGDTLTLGAILMRWMMLLVDFYACLMGVLFIAFTRRHQRIGDLAAGTMVIRQTDMSRMHISLGEFAYARRGYKPTYDNAAQLSHHQADILRRTVAPDAKASDERIESLAAKVARVIQLPANADWGNSREFLTTVLNDYLYLTTQNRS